MDRGDEEISVTIRYARQVVLPEVGDAGQQKLTAARVLVVGAGGLGCPVLQYLAGAGVGHVIIVDPDMVEETNLHRQPLYRMSDIGRPKVEAAAEALRSFNPEVEIEAQRAALDPANAPALAAAADIVVDAADSFAATYILSDACRAAGKPLVSASVIGFTGYAGGYCGGAPSYRAVFPDLPAQVTDCASAGVTGPAVGLLGSLQAQLVLSILLGLEPSPLGQVITIDLRRLTFGGFSFRDASEPGHYFPFISRAEVGNDDRVLELRSVAEAPVPAVPQARRVDVANLFDESRGAGRIVLCCRTGLRAWRGAKLLHGGGHRDLALLAVGA